MRRRALALVVAGWLLLACGGDDSGGASGDVRLEPVDESHEDTTTTDTVAAPTTAVDDAASPDESEIRECLAAAGVALSSPDEELPPLSARVAIGVLPGQGSFDPGGFVGVIFLFETEDEAAAVANSDIFDTPSTFVSGSVLVALDGSEPPEVLAALEDCAA